jgi:hypothetical protein
MSSEELRNRANILLTQLRILYSDQIKPGNRDEFEDLQIDI